MFGSTIFAIRLVPAVAGILTVVALFAYGRRNFGFGTAALAAAMLAVSSWHIGISRLAIPLAAWPLVGLLTAGALCEALRARGPGATRSVPWRWWAAAGAFAGLGVYVYDANNFFVVVLALFLAGVAVVRRRELRPLLVGAALMAAAFLVVAAAMIRYAAENPDGYLGHARYASIFNKPQWKSLHGAGAKAVVPRPALCRVLGSPVLRSRGRHRRDRPGAAGTPLLLGAGRVRDAARALEAPRARR